MFSAKFPVPGDEAPPFSLIDQHSHTVALSDFKGKAAVLLYFYAAPFCSRSRKDLLRLKEAHPDLQRQGMEVLAVNPFDWERQHQLANMLALPFSLLYDPLSKVAKAYRAKFIPTFINSRKLYKIDIDGRIAWCKAGALPTEFST